MTTSDESPEDKAGALENEPDDQLKRISVLWEEYKYRHDLCWRVLFRLTSAVVILAIVPYVYEKVVQTMPEWVLWAPALLALVLAFFGYFLMKNELDVFYGVKDEYRNLKEKRLYVKDARKPDKDTIGSRLLVYIHKRTRKHDEDTKGTRKHDEDTISFRVLVNIYLGILILLSLINIIVVVTKLPR